MELDLLGIIPDERGIHCATLAEELRLFITDDFLLNLTAQQFLGYIKKSILRRMDADYIRKASVNFTVPPTIYSNLFLRHIDNDQLKFVWRREKQIDQHHKREEATRLELFVDFKLCLQIFGIEIAGEIEQWDVQEEPFYSTILFTNNNQFKVCYTPETGNLTIKFDYIVYRKEGDELDII